MSPILSIIIPAYNEEKRIGNTISTISSFLYTHNISFELIIVANNCTDNTVLFVQNMKVQIPEIRVIDVPRRGIIGNMKGYAIGVGMRSARGQHHLFIDADNATRFDHVLEFMEYAEKGYGVVISSRYVPGAHVTKKQPLYRIILSRLGNLIIRLFLLPGIYDTQCGFKLFTNTASLEIFSHTTINGWGADLEMLAIAQEYNFKIKEVPVYWEAQDESTVRSHAFIQTLKELFVIRKNIKMGLYHELNKSLSRFSDSN